VLGAYPQNPFIIARKPIQTHGLTPALRTLSR
jgi:hypothetical protein